MSAKTRTQHPESASVSALKCIDLSSPDIQSSVSLLKQACLDTGFFYVINHEVDNEFMEEVFFQSKRFFDLPVEEKMKLLRNEKNRGYTPVFDEHLDPVNQIHGDYKEGYYIGIELSEDDPDTQKPFYGPNLWPLADILPAWRETMEKYHQKALEVAKAVSRLIAQALDLKFDFFDQTEMLGKPIAVLRLLHYADQVSEPAKGIFGAGAHSDFGLITLLATDNVFGLQICRDKDANPQIWEYVPPLKGAFIVNLGDMLERWSNCTFRSTLHRVVCTGQERYSVKKTHVPTPATGEIVLQWDFLARLGVYFGEPECVSSIPSSGDISLGLDWIAYFVEPNHDCIVECLPTCKSQNNPPMFPPIKCQDYLVMKYKDTHADLNSYHVSK